MSDHARPKMKTALVPGAGFAEEHSDEAAPFPQKQPIPHPGFTADMLPAGAVLAEWRPRSHGRAGAVAALQMLEALDEQRTHLKDQVHLYDGCTKLVGDD